MDLLFNGECTGVLKILPYLIRSRGVNRFPLVIGLSHIETQEWIWSFLKKGADGFITKEQFIYILSQGKEAFYAFIAQCLLKDIDLWSGSLGDFAKKEIEIRLTGEKLEDEEQFLVKRIFYPYIRYLEKGEKLLLETSIVSGRSGAKSLKVLPHISRTGGAFSPSEKERLLHPRFVKLDTLHNITNEKYAFEAYIRGALENFCGRIDDPVAYGREKAGIAYTGIGLMEDYKGGRGPIPLRNFLIEREEEEIIKALEIIYSRILMNLHEITYTPESSLSGFLSKFYPLKDEATFTPSGSDELEILEGKLEKDRIRLKLWEKEKEKVYTVEYSASPSEEILLLLRPGKMIRGRISPSSSHFKYVRDNISRCDSNLPGYIYTYVHGSITERLSKVENLFRSVEEIRSVEEMGGWYAIIHGDLNLDAIQCTPPQNFWLIDFAKTQKGFVAIDYVKLEVEIRTHLISDYLSRVLVAPVGNELPIQDMERQLMDIEDRLLKAKFSPFSYESFGFYYPWMAPHRTLKKLLVAINRIRCLFWLNYQRCSGAGNEDEKEAWKEYLYTLFHYAIETTKFKNLRKSEGGSESAPLPLMLSLILAEKAGEELCWICPRAESDRC